MIDPVVRIAMAVCIMMAGMGAALMFRHAAQLAGGPDAPAVSQTVGGEKLALRHRAGGTEPVTPAGREKQSTPASITLPSSGEQRRTATVVAPSGPRESPPQLPESYPEPDAGHSPRWGVSLNMLMPVAVPPNEAQRTHKVVDGDTLSTLAEHYLGSADRAKEVFEANRSMLSDPRLLPIGVELKIPPRDKRAD